jgi:hypothetical protein
MFGLDMIRPVAQAGRATGRPRRLIGSARDVRSSGDGVDGRWFVVWSVNLVLVIPCPPEQWLCSRPGAPLRRQGGDSARLLAGRRSDVDAPRCAWVVV